MDKFINFLFFFLFLNRARKMLLKFSTIFYEGKLAQDHQRSSISAQNQKYYSHSCLGKAYILTRSFYSICCVNIISTIFNIFSSF